MLGSVLIVAPATMLTHWLRELAVWAPGLRRVIVHKSGEADGVARVVSKGMLRSLQRWLKKAREDRVNEPIDEDDFRNPSNPEHMFCGVGYAVVTTYDNIRRSQDEWTGHNWSYVVLDEGQVRSDNSNPFSSANSIFRKYAILTAKLRWHARGCALQTVFCSRAREC